MNFVTLDGHKFYPSKVVCIGRNYVAHIEELNNEIPDRAVVFIKPNSSISQEIHSAPKEIIHYESEITFLVIAGVIKGVGFGLDLTKRELQSELKSKGLPWERAKAFDHSAVFSEFVSFDGDLDCLTIELTINKTLAQLGSCQLMLIKPNEFLQEVKTFLSLENGDLLMSGTPKGVGPIRRGDKFTGKIYASEKLLVEKSWIVK